MTDKPPKGAVASVEDFRVKRDDKGELIPVWEPIPGSQNTCTVCDGTGFQFDAETEDENTCENCEGDGYVKSYAKVVPLEQGAANRYIPDNGDPSDMSNRQTAKLLNERFVEPSFDIDVTNAEAEMDDFNVFGVEPLILCVYNASGFELAKGMILENTELTQAIEGNSKNGS